MYYKDIIISFFILFNFVITLRYEYIGSKKAHKAMAVAYSDVGRNFLSWFHWNDSIPLSLFDIYDAVNHIL